MLPIRKINKKESSRVIYVSNVDAAFVKVYKSSHRNIEVITNGVDINFFKAREKKKSKNIKFLFIGNLSYHPNRRVVEFINSKLARDFPDNKFEIVGSGGNKILSKPKKNVRIEGYVNDVRKYFSENTIFICPMDTGSGIKNKIMEAIAMESVVIATEMSLEGFSPQILEHTYSFRKI